MLEGTGIASLSRSRNGKARRTASIYAPESILIVREMGDSASKQGRLSWRAEKAGSNFTNRMHYPKQTLTDWVRLFLLQARKHDRPMPFEAPDWARQFTRDDLKLRLYATPGEESAHARIRVLVGRVGRHNRYD